jgi:hypothetical protein
MGRTAVRMLHERIEGSTDPFRHVVLPATMHKVGAGQNSLGVLEGDASGVLESDASGVLAASPRLSHRTRVET